MSGRFVARASDVGFSPPPVALHIKLAGSPRAVFVRSEPPGPLARIVPWLEPLAPSRLEFGPGHVLRVEFDQVPPAWRAVFQDVHIEHLYLEPDGSATMSVVGSRSAVERFASLIAARGHALDVRSIHPASAAPRLLTAPQEQAIAAALEHGYYDIPRPINLHDLAAKLGVSSASLSERLRRAEGRIIRQFAAAELLHAPPAAALPGPHAAMHDAMRMLEEDPLRGG